MVGDLSKAFADIGKIISPFFVEVFSILPGASLTAIALSALLLFCVT